MVYHLA